MELEIPGSGDVEKRSLRSEDFICDEAWRTSKMSRTEADFSVAANAAVSSAFPDYWQPRNSGYYTSVSSDASTGVYLLNGVKGPFTLSQWLELEQQALIYRYITANQPIPIQLLIPIRKAFDSAGFYGLHGGWGSFHMGYSNSTDPEPGRCRRTDGKKWRCSKEAVENQKYCDKHINRGRHRSRKHVECQATKPSTTKPVLPDCGSSNGKNLQTIGSNQNMNTSLNRTIVNNRDSFPQPALRSYGSNANVLDHPKEPEPRDSPFTLDNWPKDNHINVDFMSSTCTPTNEKVSFTPQWEASMGGPLAEALQSKSISNKADESMTNSVMTLLPNGWEGNGRSQLSSSSPNFVLQMSSLVSLSTNSAGSSPMADMYGSVT